MELLASLHADGSTICMVTHDARYAEHAQRVVDVKDGRVISPNDARVRSDVQRASPTSPSALAPRAPARPPF
jgi:ABC-type lipoprotein export system ATPase subunit